MSGPRLDGVTFLDHTADVGIDVRAATLAQLFERAALGMLALLRGEDDPDEDDQAASAAAGAGAAAGATAAAPSTRPAAPAELELAADSTVALLADWLRELLFLHEVEHRDFAGVEFRQLEPGSLRAVVRTEAAAPAIREIKGVTYHELSVEETEHGWKGRVIFDV